MVFCCSPRGFSFLVKDISLCRLQVNVRNTLELAVVFTYFFHCPSAFHCNRFAIWREGIHICFTFLKVALIFDCVVSRIFPIGASVGGMPYSATLQQSAFLHQCACHEHHAHFCFLFHSVYHRP